MRLIPSLLLLLSLTVLAGCEQKQSSVGDMKFSPVDSQFKNTDVTGLQYAKDFALTDHNGKPRTLADFKGKAVLIFFGYTQCPDVCPTTMAEMAAVMKELGPQADKVQVLFVTLDPERDTAELLSKYVPAFDPRFLGLYGDMAATAAVAKEFKIFYQKVDGKSAGSYTIDHTAGSYVFDPQGRVRLFVKHGQGAAPIAHDIKLLLDQS
ncbi:SCO family protein [Actimicrobium sp. CCI2.3]|uniref:SCO family protein n=1 Tax=Actimicrobium sp. CCI2.3 TaxID=3048616 RepID=UPI002AB36A79|nr:SCO family protein [Actimicrobium sp. CCI2.3]MDY7576292.1 SCO family protein [Actimicrobium sp. CCI2.3]MEB0020504.1 SCO family protein [Actimicrobium sp. CCI2.3]